MGSIDWKAKLTSRKFWLAIVGFVAPLLTAFGLGNGIVTQVTAIIMSGASVVAYIVGEGLVDAAAASSGVNTRGRKTVESVPTEQEVKREDV